MRSTEYLKSFEGSVLLASFQEVIGVIQGTSKNFDWRDIALAGVAALTDIAINRGIGASTDQWAQLAESITKGMVRVGYSLQAKYGKWKKEALRVFVRNRQNAVTPGANLSALKVSIINLCFTGVFCFAGLAQDFVRKHFDPSENILERAKCAIGMR